MRRTLSSSRATFAVAACLAATVLVSARQSSPAARPTFPARGAWPKAEPSTLGLDRAKLADAIAFAVANQNRDTQDLAVAIPNSFRIEAPYNTLIGPTAPRAESNGIIIRHGKVAAEWGDTSHVDMTFSVTKTFLSTVVGLAFDRGKIKSVTDRVAGYMPKGVDLFASPHNAPITWEHLLRQTSDWSGTLWGKPDWADRPARGQTPEQWEKRQMHAPGTFFKYNDTRVNVLALSALYLLGQPLPEVLKTSIMDPIGASETWHWEAYDNAWVEINGRKMKSVTGGGHFGGGMFINAYDMARFGYLALRNGKWRDRQLISEQWLSFARTPTPAEPTYGFMNFFLNTQKKFAPSAPESAFMFIGNGANVIYVDQEHDLVAVVRWIDNKAMDGFVKRLLAAAAG